MKSFGLTKHIVRLAIILALGVYPLHPALSQVPTSPELTKLHNLSEAIRETEAMLAKYPDSDFTANLMFQLAELYVHRAKLRFEEQMALYETAEEEFEQGRRSEEPVMPKVDYGDAFDIAYLLMKKYPDVHFLNELFYKMAGYHLDAGDPDKAIEYFVHLADNAEDKQLLEDANFRVGEYFFQQQDYASSAEYYRRLLDGWDSPYFDMALYKLGWCYYNLEEYAEAISTFIYLIDDINLLEEVDTEYLGRTKADLRSEAKEYIASCFTEFGGPEKARSFLAERKNEDYSEPVLLHLADLYKKRNFYSEAIATLNVLLDFYPDTSSAASYVEKIVENYELAEDKEKSTEMRTRFFTKYGPGSEWLDALNDEKIRQDVLKTSQEYLYSLATESQAKAQEQKSKSDYEAAIIRYQLFIQNFPESERAGKAWFFLAECYFEVSDYTNAADAYYELLLGHADSEYLESASYNRILAYDKLLRASGISDSTYLHLENFLGQNSARVDSIKVAGAGQAQFLQASNDFVVYLPSSAKLPEVVMKFAENLYVLEAYDLAKEAYRLVIDHPATNGRLPQAYTMIAQCEFKQQNYADAEEWFQKLIVLNPDSSRYVLKANMMIASAKFKVAEDLLASGDTSKAAVEFERVAATVAEREIAEKAIFEAALLYENRGNKNKAASLYESLSKEFIDSKLVGKSLFKAGLLREELEQWQPAAVDFVTVFERDRASEFASRSLFFAARNYENAGDYKNARHYFDLYAKVYKDNPDRAIEAAFRKGEIAHNQRDLRSALKDFNAVVKLYQQYRTANKPAETYFPANAQFLIGEIMHDTFQKTKLTAPLERNLKRKRAKFQQTVKAYTAAAKYKQAEWSTASSYRIGVAFEEFAKALLDSPRPKKLSEKDLIAYNQKLWQSVLPFKDKAFKTYQASVRQAAKNNIDNKWVVESKKRLGSLASELGLETVGLDTESSKSSTN
jgi:TolA-binding protein